MSIPIGARVWAIYTESHRIELIHGVVVAISTAYPPAAVIDARLDGTVQRLYAHLSTVVLDEDADTLALHPGHHESGLRRLVGEAVTAIRMETRLDALDPDLVEHFGRWLRSPEDDGSPRLWSLCHESHRLPCIAAGLVQTWPGDETPPELTELGHALARRLSHP